MKTTVSIISLVAALSLFEETAVRGAPTAAVEVQNAQTKARVSQADAARQMELAREQAKDAEFNFEEAELNFAGFQNQFQLAEADLSDWATSGDHPFNRRYADRTQPLFRRTGGGSKSLVIRSGDNSDPAAQTNLEEDLAVMSRLFDKSVNESVGEPKRGRTVMGIDVVFAPGSNPVRNLYLDGYGAVFLLRVNFPLLASPRVKEEPKEKPAADSSWEEARRELYGQPGEGKIIENAGEEFDPEKVNKLKVALLESLKSAVNIRNLKPDDNVTVCVFGDSGPGTVRAGKTITRVVPMEGEDAVGPRKAPAGVVASSSVDSRARQVIVQSLEADNAPGRGTVMTIRVKKSDVDAFAKGKLSLEEFRKQASITAYRGGAEAGGAFGRGGSHGGFSGGYGIGAFEEKR